MVAVLLWDISKSAVQGLPTEECEQQLLGRTFEKLGQERRIDVLVSLKIIGSDQASTFSELKAIRNKYLHLLSHSHENLDEDARKAFECAAKLVQLLFSAKLEQGDVMLRPELAKYLEAAGVLDA